MYYWSGPIFSPIYFIHFILVFTTPLYLPPFSRPDGSHLANKSNPAIWSAHVTEDYKKADSIELHSDSHCCLCQGNRRGYWPTYQLPREGRRRWWWAPWWSRRARGSWFSSISAGSPPPSSTCHGRYICLQSRSSWTWYSDIPSLSKSIIWL